MILGSDSIAKRIRENDLITGFPDGFIVEGTTADLTISYLIEKTNEIKPFLLVDSRETGWSEETEVRYINGKKVWVLEPGKVYIGLTAETLNLPNDIFARFAPRITTFLSGLFIATGFVQPGYYGQIRFAMVNLGGTVVYMEPGFRIIGVSFEQIDGDTNRYDGYHQGGSEIHMTTDGKGAPSR